MTYGLSKEKNSYLYDPKYTFATTVNGQLLLLMLTEALYENVKCQMVQVNTDGLTLKFKKKDEELVRKICKRFEKYTDLELEYQEYSKMIVRDVNNYIAIDMDGNAKKKGVFETVLSLREGTKGVPWHKNPSNMIVKLAACEYFINGKDYNEYIDENNNIHDYCAATKTQSSFTLNLYHNDGGILRPTKQQKITRYYVSKEGGYLIKNFHDGRITSVPRLSGIKVKTCNIIDENKVYDDIDKDYYKEETRKLVDSVLNPED